MTQEPSQKQTAWIRFLSTGLSVFVAIMIKSILVEGLSWSRWLAAVVALVCAIAVSMLVSYTCGKWLLSS